VAKEAVNLTLWKWNEMPDGVYIMPVFKLQD
jgi:hypothetical protein